MECGEDGMFKSGVERDFCIFLLSLGALVASHFQMKSFSEGSGKICGVMMSISRSVLF